MQKSLESQPSGLCDGMTAAFHDVAETCLPKVEVKARRPWITNETLTVISRRNEARQHGNFALEQQLSVLSKRRVRIDRTDWLEALLSSGDRAKSVNYLLRGFCPKQGHLLNSVGQAVDSDDRAEVFAEHFEKRIGQRELSHNLLRRKV